MMGYQCVWETTPPLGDAANCSALTVILARDVCRISAVPPLPWQDLGKCRRDGHLQTCCEHTQQVNP